MSNIRVTYSGLISLLVGIVSTITGLIFTLIVTRKLETEEFAIWSLIGSLIVYVMILDPISSFWATRQIARGEKVVGTAIGSSVIFAIIATGIYQVIIYYITITTDADYNILLLSSLMIPLLYLRKEVKAVLNGFKPEGTSYGLLIFEVTKIPLGLIFVYWWDLTDYLKQTQYGHLSAKLHRQGDCKTFRYKFLRFYFYKEPMGGGVGQVEEPEEKDWQYPHPNSAQSVILKSVCNYVN